MFVNNEITNRGLLHKLLKKAVVDVTMDERRVWARSVEGAIKDASRPSTPFRRSLTRPAVVIGAAPGLSAVAAVLRDDKIAVSREAIDAVRTFMTDGIDSPLYGSDPLAARRGAEALRGLVVANASAKRAHEVAHGSTAA
ncbi:MAG: hypothetical protein M3Q31_05520 [Actinomycetota bacterium]|nr:hypothetical protein [Actinomycetota bacterium]